MPNWDARRKAWSGFFVERPLRRIDTGVLAGLVTTCRYAGLFEESKAAHARAVMLDPARDHERGLDPLHVGRLLTRPQSRNRNAALLRDPVEVVTGQLTADGCARKKPRPRPMARGWR